MVGTWVTYYLPLCVWHKASSLSARADEWRLLFSGPVKIGDSSFCFVVVPIHVFCRNQLYYGQQLLCVDKLNVGRLVWAKWMMMRCHALTCPEPLSLLPRSISLYRNRRVDSLIEAPTARFKLFKSSAGMILINHPLDEVERGLRRSFLEWSPQFLVNNWRSEADDRESTKIIDIQPLLIHRPLKKNGHRCNTVISN